MVDLKRWGVRFLALGGARLVAFVAVALVALRERGLDGLALGNPLG